MGEGSVMYLFWFFLVANPLFLIWLALRSFIVWGGFWRVLALLPLAFFIIHVAVLFFAINRDPYSHNLWPFEIIITSFLGWSGLLCLYLIRAMFRPDAPPKDTGSSHEA
jgi:hypothetical protein